jgi:hypothetical protein
MGREGWPDQTERPRVPAHTPAHESAAEVSSPCLKFESLEASDLFQPLASAELSTTEGLMMDPPLEVSMLMEANRLSAHEQHCPTSPAMAKPRTCSL